MQSLCGDATKDLATYRSSFRKGRKLGTIHCGIEHEEFRHSAGIAGRSVGRFHAPAMR